MASPITGVSIVYSTVVSDAYQSFASLAFSSGNSLVTDEFPAQKGSYAENVSIWWRHHVMSDILFSKHIT